MKMICVLAVALFFISCKQSSPDETEITITTDLGNIHAVLYPKKAPKTVAAILSYIDKGLYNNTSFYRVLVQDDLGENSGILQGGVWRTAPALKPVQGIPHEPTGVTGLTHTDGTLSLARTTPGSGSSEFFICIGDQTQYDEGRIGTEDKLGFAAFGKVVSGMGTVKKIQQQKASGDMLVKPVMIKNIKRD